MKIPALTTLFGVLGAALLLTAAGHTPVRAQAQSDDARVAAGKKLTVDTCANDHCHGGSARSFDDMAGVTEQRIRKVIAEGIPDAGMPAFRAVFTPEQVDAIVAYVLSAAGSGSDASEPAAAHTSYRAAGQRAAPHGRFAGRVLPAAVSLR